MKFCIVIMNYKYVGGRCIPLKLVYSFRHRKMCTNQNCFFETVTSLNSAIKDFTPNNKHTIEVVAIQSELPSNNHILWYKGEVPAKMSPPRLVKPNSI